MHITITDQQLADINGNLKWLMFQRDAAGRTVGGGDWDYPLVDTRLQLLLDRLGPAALAGRRVLEPGCLDGHLTVGLCGAGADVTAFDVRPSCVIKTFARSLAFGFQPRLLLHDARRMAELGTFDLVYHSGVFYHLEDPVEHLRSIAAMAPMMALDTHTARPEEPLDAIDGYEGCWAGEFGWHDEQSGLGPRSFWLTRPELFRLFNECGFAQETLWQDDAAPNGPRGFYLLKRS
ncbi:MAG TPA: methyltransferase domain-containing protein [Pirellulales bacterium]|nr:methyltransferase domain-containing protein [Pirellulales bacterium]